MDEADHRVISFAEAVRRREQARINGERVVLTNGCFDLLHRGHVDYLEQSALLGDRLFVALNSDASVRELKGPGRPVNREMDRAKVLASLRCIDTVTIFPGPRLAEEILQLSPDVYTKAGDYQIETLDPTERAALEQIGAQIQFIPFVQGYSTTATLNRNGSHALASPDKLDFRSTLSELAKVCHDAGSIADLVKTAGSEIVSCLERGGKILSCGNGGSAADALHLTEELVGRYHRDRKSLPGICLNADVTMMTCISNDYGYENVFARQVEGLGSSGDILVGFTTSGNSPNVLAAFRQAKLQQVKTVLLSGQSGGKAKSQCDLALLVPSNNTARIQEIHTVILHQWLEQVDAVFCRQSISSP